MSIAGRITQMEQHIGNAYDKIEDLGIDLTDVDKNINNISAMLENVWDEYPKVSASDVEEASINGTKKGRMKIDLKGNTEQEQLTGKNKLQITATIETKNGLTLTVYNDKTFKVTGTINTDTAFNFVLVNMQNFEPFLDKQMCLSCGYSITNNMGAIVSNFYDNNTRVLASNAFNITSSNGYTTKTVSSSTYDISNGINIRVTLFIPEGHNGETINISGYIQLEEGGAATSYEPYCGGIPSPNPDFPQQIKNVTGNANVKIQNKNLFVAQKIVDDSNSNEVYLDSDENIVFKTHATMKIKPSIIKANTSYTFKLLVKNNGNIQNNIRFSINYTDGTSVNVAETGLISDTNVRTLIFSSNSNKTIDYITAAFTYNAFATLIVDGSMILEGSYTAQTIPEYVPHQEQNLPFTFAEGQRGMQGTTLEDDGINNVRTQLIIDGTENITLSTATVGTSNFGKFDVTISKRANVNDRTALSSHLKYKFQGWTTAGNENTFSFTVPTILRLLLDINEFPTVEALKTYLANNNMTFEFVTEQPEIIPYNATQQAQYNAIKQARSYDDQTNISQTNDELPFILDIEALKNN